MQEVFEEVLALCLDRVADGDSPAACAGDFPEFPELVELLGIAAKLKDLPRPEPRPSWLTASSARLAAKIARQQSEAAD